MRYPSAAASPHTSSLAPLPELLLAVNFEESTEHAIGLLGEGNHCANGTGRPLADDGGQITLDVAVGVIGEAAAGELASSIGEHARVLDESGQQSCTIQFEAEALRTSVVSSVCNEDSDGLLAAAGIAEANVDADAEFIRLL